MDTSWKVHAACKGEDTELFFPVSESVGPEVLAICGACPVRAECLAYAIEHEDKGVWAGTSARQRRRMRKQAGITLHTPTSLALTVGQEAS